MKIGNKLTGFIKGHTANSELIITNYSNENWPVHNWQLWRWFVKDDDEIVSPTPGDIQCSMFPNTAVSMAGGIAGIILVRFLIRQSTEQEC